MFDRKDKTFSLEDFNNIAPDNPAAHADNSAARARYKRFAVNAVKFLPPKQRHVVVLYFVEGMKTPAIAEELGVNRSTVSRRLAAARKTLQELAELCTRSGLFPS